MANEYIVRQNRFKKMGINFTEYQILKLAEDHRAGREMGNEYFGYHTNWDELCAIQGYSDAIRILDDNGIIEPYGHPFRFILTEKGRLLFRIYELEHQQLEIK